jgi:hypothetical protein
MLPIEYARESRDKRITLVITDVGYTVKSLWTILSVDTLDEAKRRLAGREGIKEKNLGYSIGFWDKASGSSHGRGVDQISAWAKNRGLDAVVWTNLKCGFEGSRGTMPEYGKLLEHIGRLSADERKATEDYIRRAPIQIDTEYRRRLRRDLGWEPIVPAEPH